MAMVFLLYALFASVFTASKTGLQYSSPVFFVGSRMLLAGLILVAYLAIFKRDQLRIQQRHIWSLILLAVFNIYLTNILEFWGLQYLTSSKTCFIYSLSPFLSALFSYFMLTEKMNYNKWLGLIVGFAGFIPILLNQSDSEQSLKHFLFLSWPEISVMGAAACSVIGWILLRKMVKENGYSTFLANAGSMCIGGIMALTHSYFTENWDPIPVTETMPFLECALWLIVVSNLICYNLYGWLLTRYTATFISLAGFTTPLFTALFGWYYLGENVTFSFYLSTAIVLIGLTIFNKEELKQGYTNNSVASLSSN